MGRRGAITAVSAALVLAGCAGNDTSGPVKASAPPDLPADHRWAMVPAQHVTFAVPETWVAFSSEDSPENLAAVAKALGMSVADVKAGLPEETPLQVRALAPDPSNINATVVDLGELPVSGELESQLRGAGAEEVEVRSVPTPAGPGLLATYKHTLETMSVHGAGLFFDNGDSLLNVTVSSPDLDTATEEMDAVIASVHRS